MYEFHDSNGNGWELFGGQTNSSILVLQMCEQFTRPLPRAPMDSNGNSQVSAFKKWLALAELTCNWQLKLVNSRKFHRCPWVPVGH